MEFARSVSREKALGMFDNIPWAEYVRARAFLTMEDVNVLQRTEEASLDITLGDQDMSARLVAVLQKVVALINDTAAQQYALTRIDDVLSGKCDISDSTGSAQVAMSAKELRRRALLFRDPKAPADGPFTVDVPVFMRVLRTDGPDAYCKAAASHSLARLLVASDASSCEPLVYWICDALAAGPGGNHGSSSGGGGEIVAAAVRALALLLRRSDARKLFCQNGGVGYLTKLLRHSKSGATPGGGGGGSGGSAQQPNAQLMYELTFSLWALSFDEDAQQLFVAAGAVPVLADQVTAAPREKVVRVSLATLRNLCGAGENSGFSGDSGGDMSLSTSAPGGSSSASMSATLCACTTVLIGCGLPKTLANLKDRAWADPDIAEDVEAVYGALMANYRELSTFERWASEVTTAQLKWGSKLVHCEKFWRENAALLEQHDFKLLKELVALLDSLEAEVVAVACFDLGEFVRFYPGGKSLLRSYGAKDRVMQLIEHDNLEVQREALQCMSKIMVNQWEFMR